MRLIRMISYAALISAIISTGTDVGNDAPHPRNAKNCLNYCSLIPEKNELHKFIKEMDCRVECRKRFGF